ncbi:microtubule associated protein-domain-containing protein [Umbelopsis sp. PMI_123]|nr:microtubule associated protein-domain-containing protein [Umbelopsis sp. PMI_123]
MDMDELLTYIVSHCEKISLLYEEIGTSEKARRENTQSLFDSFVHLMNQQTKTITEERESLKRKCHDTLSSIAHYKRLMGTYVDEKVLETPKQPLLAWLSELCDTDEIYQRKYEAKLENLKALHTHVNELREALVDFVECEPIDEKDADVSEPAIQHIEKEIARCEAEYDRRANLVKDLNRKIEEHWNTLGVTAKDDLDHTLRKLCTLSNDEDEDAENTLLITLVSPIKLDAITQKLEALTEFRSEREFRVDELLHQIMKIWDLLSIDETTREIFKDENYGLREENVKRFENELQRLTIIKQERMEEFIKRAREELKMLWDQLYYSEEQRQKFKPAYTESVADEILEAHEKEITRTHILIEDQKHILERVEKHMRLVEEIKQFEASMSDPNRLFGKGQRDPGRLLREEKFRRRIARELPKVKRELRSALKEYQETNGDPFCVFGKPYTETIDEQEEQEQAKAVRSSRNAKRSSSEMLDTPKRVVEKRITKTPSTTPRTKPKALLSTPHRHPTTALDSTPSNRRKRIRSHLEEAGLNDTSDNILHKVREHNLNVLKSALQPLNDNQLPPSSTIKVTEAIKGVPRAGSPTPRARVVWSDEDIDEGIFDDGPDLSDLEN